MRLATAASIRDHTSKSACLYNTALLVLSNIALLPEAFEMALSWGQTRRTAIAANWHQASALCMHTAPYVITVEPC
jgi:hypothetical protein